jgi:SAM-dependent methyltransferase
LLKVLNLGCGFLPLINDKKRTYINIDLLKLTEKQTIGANYVRHNLTKFPYPFEDETFDEIYLSHVIEHIDEGDHPMLIQEVRRLCKPDGTISWIYPEFITIAQNYILNKRGDRDYWKQCIYGRSGKGGMDRHVALIDTPFFIDLVKVYGLIPEKVFTDKKEDYNTVLICRKGQPLKTYEELLKDEVNRTVRR